MKNIIYQSPSYSDAKEFIERNKIENAMIDSFVRESTTDPLGTIIERRTYEVYVLVTENF